MQVYSHSRLSTFENCPLKFKFKYIDKVETEIEESIESFLGKIVHEVLEKLYRDLKFQKQNSLQDLLNYLDKIWEEKWNDGIIIVREEYSKENYKKMAIKFITDFYNRYKPFNQDKTISIEHRVLINLDKKGRYKLQGYVDRISYNSEGEYEIHDYKTNANLPIQDYLENDRQLALYAIAVKEAYKDAKDVKLVWHFLAFDKEQDSYRSEKQLEQLKKDTIELIKKIENEKKFEARVSKLCDWCEFRPICPKWAHLYKLENKEVNEYLKDSGVKLVNKYSELMMKKNKLMKEIDSDLNKLKEAIIKFSKKEKVDVVFGSDAKINVWIKDVIKFPGKNEEENELLKQLLLKEEIYPYVSNVDAFKLAKMVEQKGLSNELMAKIKKFQRIERIERLYINKINNKK